MNAPDVGAVWFASYPKSGNTWLRVLLDAYRRNGKVDINDIRSTSADSGVTIMQGVSPMPVQNLGLTGQLLLRPAALLNLFCRLTQPVWVKTHFVNMQPVGLPHCIPKEFTKKAVYVVRDPRSVLLSMARFYGHSIEMAVELMRNKDFRIGNSEQFASILVSSWSNHVASWTSEKNFEVHVVKYEDMLENAGRELIEVLEFLEQDVDLDTVELAVNAAKLGRLQKKENEEGFCENSSQFGKFFNKGGVRWQDELGLRWIKQIEEDHGEIMRHLGYLTDLEHTLTGERIRSVK